MSRQSLMFALTVPSTTKRSQALISPESTISRPTTRVRVAVCGCARGDSPFAFWAALEAVSRARSAMTGGGAVGRVGCVGGSGNGEDFRMVVRMLAMITPRRVTAQ